VSRDGAARIRALGRKITTPRLELRWPEARRNNEVVRLANDPSVARYTLRIPYPYTRSDAEEFLRLARSNRRKGRSAAFQVVRRRDRTLLGGVSLEGISDPRGTVEVGYFLGRAYRGEGYATEAVLALTDAAFRTLRVQRVEAYVLPGNRKSEAVLRRSGFRREGRLRGRVVKDGRPSDVIVYGRLRSDPSPRAGSGGRTR
jgi:RimJ/RimL family protein N-acetyltransferase